MKNINRSKKNDETCRTIRFCVAATWLALALFCFSITPALFRYSYAMRGYNAIGGEYLVPAIPFLFMPQFFDLSNALCNLSRRIRSKKKTSLSCARKG